LQIISGKESRQMMFQTLTGSAFSSVEYFVGCVDKMRPFEGKSTRKSLISAVLELLLAIILLRL